MPKLINSLTYFLSSNSINPHIFDTFEKYTTEAIIAGTKNKHTPPLHPFFELCDSLFETSKTLTTLLDNEILALKYELFNL